MSMRLCSWSSLLAIGFWSSALAAPPVRDQPDLDLLGSSFPAVSVRHADGRVLVGGDIVRAGATPVRHLARFNADGSLDTGFQPQLPFWADDLELDSQGRAYVMLRPFSAASRGDGPQVVRVLDDASGSIDPGFQLELPAGVEDSGLALLVDEPANALYAAYTRTPGSDYIVRRHVLATGALDPAFQLSTNNLVLDLARSGPHLLVAGFFSQIGGQAIPGVARVDAASGAVDIAWNPAAAGQSAGLKQVRQLLLDGDHVFIAGNFQGLGAAGTRGLARISLTTGSADPQWQTAIIGNLSALARDGAGRLLVAGAPTSLGGQSWTSSVTRFNPDGSHDSGFGFAADVRGGSSARWLHVLADDSVLTALYSSGNEPPGLARYSAAAGVRELWSPVALFGVPLVRRMLPAPSQGFSLLTPFAWLDDAPQVGALQLAADLQPQAGWRSDLGDLVGFISPLDGAVSSQHLYLAGFISEAPSRPAVRRLVLSDGATDAAWVPAVSPPNQPSSNRVAVDEPAGFVYIAGSGGLTLNRFSLSIGARDTTWTPTSVLGSQIAQMQLHDGQLYVAGSFSTVGGQAIPRLARIPTAGSGAPDAGWVPAPAGASTFHIDAASGWIYVGGSDSTGVVVLRRYGLVDAAPDPLWEPLRGRAGSISRLSFDSQRGELVALGQMAAGCDGRQVQAVRFVGEGRRVAPDWSIELGVNGSLSDALVLDDGDVLVAGSFESINGESRQSLARVGAGDTIFSDSLGDAGGCVL